MKRRKRDRDRYNIIETPSGAAYTPRDAELVNQPPLTVIARLTEEQCSAWQPHLY